MNALVPIQQVREELLPLKTEFATMLPSHITADRFTEVIMTALERDPELMAADRQSLIIAAKEAANDGLLPDKKEGAFVVYNTKKTVPGQQNPNTPNVKPLDRTITVPTVKWMPMIYGIRKKMFQTGMVKDVTTELVYEHDFYEREAGDNGRITHKPLDFGDRGKIKGGYSIIATKEGGVFREVMSLDDIMAVAKTARSDKVWNGPFKTEMMRKTVLRRLAKQVPLSAEVERVLSRDDAMYDLGSVRVVRGDLLAGGERHQAVRQMSNQDLLEDAPAKAAPAETESTPDPIVAQVDEDAGAQLATEWATRIRRVSDAYELGDVVEEFRDLVQADIPPLTGEQERWAGEVIFEKMKEFGIDYDQAFGILESIDAWIAQNPAPEDTDEGGGAEPDAAGDEEPASEETADEDGEVIPDVPPLQAILTREAGLKQWEDPSLWMTDFLNKMQTVKGDVARAFWDANERFVLHAREAGHKQHAERIMKVAADRGLYKPEG